MATKLLVALVTKLKNISTWQYTILSNSFATMMIVTFDVVHKCVEISFIDAACLFILAKRSARSLPAIANLTGR